MAYIATFMPQAWINNNAVAVDPIGKTEWEPRAVPEYIVEALAAGTVGEVIDNDDELKDDDNAPLWVRNWSGPFTILVRIAEGR
jgi:hypothetical protein